MGAMRIILVAILAALFTQTPAPSLRIVVIEGEGAVNIIQQKTAVRPLVEVRDRNNVPVSGATVTFALNGQPAAFANGAATMTVTTNAQGQAAAAGFNAVRQGAVQIQVSAAHQGQVATAMISQTNFATAAAAAAAGVAATSIASTAAAGAAGAGAGGGISGTTIAIVGAAVGGGAVVATQVGGGDSSDENQTEGSTGPGTTLPEKHYIGQLTGSMTVTLPSGCVTQRSISGSVDLNYRTSIAVYQVAAPVTSSTGGIAICPSNYNPSAGGEAPLSGVPSTPNFKVDVPTNQGTSIPMTQTVEFSGTLNGDTITGTLKYTETYSSGPGGTVSIPVTLR